MTSMFGLFIGAAIIFALALYVYESARDSEYKKVLVQLRELKLEQEKTTALVAKNAETVGRNHVLVNNFTNQITELEKEVEHLFVYCGKLQKGQIEIQDKVSKRRPVMKFNGLIPVEIHTPSVRGYNKKGKTVSQ